MSGETFKKLVESNHVLRRVPPHLPPHVRDRLTSAEPEDYLQKLRATREATPERQGSGLLIHIVCRHREPDVAADLANAFAAATEEYFTSRQQEEERYALAYLAEASDKARREAEATAAELAHPGLPEDRRQKLETALQSQRFIAEQIAQRLAEVRTGGSTSTHTLRITPATTPGVSDYSSPNHSLDLSIGLLVGALAAGANTLIRRRSDPR